MSNTQNDFFLRKFTTAYEFGASGGNPYFKFPGINTEYHSRTITSFASNDYLSLSTDPRVIEAGVSALRTYGTGCGSSMAGSGALKIHEEFSESFADFLGKESVMLLPTGYSAMLGFTSFNLINGAKVFSDLLNHRCILDGLSLGQGAIHDQQAHVHHFLHNQPSHFESVLKQNTSENKYNVLMIEGVYSGDGDRGKLDEFLPICRSNNVIVAIDDAHALGVLGKQGRGTASEFKLTEEIDFILGTFSKSFAGIGGYIAGSSTYINYLKANMGIYIFSASIPPPVIGVANYILNLLKTDGEELRAKLWNNITYLRSALQELGFDTLKSDSAIIPVMLRDRIITLKYAACLLEQGFYVVPFVYPAVKKGHERLRISVNAGHTREQMNRFLDCMQQLKQEGMQ